MSMDPQTCREIAVGGAGPAGLALATCLARRGLAVNLYDPELSGNWKASYGVWEREIAHLQLEEAIAERYPRPTIRLPKGELIHLNETYVRFSTNSLQKLLRDRALQAGVRFTESSLPELTRPDSAEHLLVDATGRTNKSQPAAFQTAYGVWLPQPKRFFPEGQMTLMDYTPAYTTEGQAPPSFLYAMDEPDGRLFVQETVLIGSHPADFKLLATRLEERLSTMGLDIRTAIEAEHCLIPMSVTVPPRNADRLYFGAAAAMVHPATGYQLARTLGLAETVAKAVGEQISNGARQAALAGTEAAWPTEARRSWELYRWGASVLQELPPEQLRDFIRAFFRQPNDTWRRYMTGTLPPADILSLMGNVFARSPSRLRWKLVTETTRHATHALKSITLH